MGYDPKCYDLAETFLADEGALNTEKNRDELAQLIQTTIEDHLAFGLSRTCPICKGEKKVGYLSAGKPPEQGDCYQCGGTGAVPSNQQQRKEP